MGNSYPEVWAQYYNQPCRSISINRTGPSLPEPSKNRDVNMMPVYTEPKQNLDEMRRIRTTSFTNQDTNFFSPGCIPRSYVM